MLKVDFYDDYIAEYIITFFFQNDNLVKEYNSLNNKYSIAQFIYNFYLNDFESFLNGFDFTIL